MNTAGKSLAAVGILLVAGAACTALMLTRKKPQTEPTPPKPTLVQAIPAATRSETFRVQTQGTVEPLRETVLIPEVSGRIISTSPAFQAGGFFEEGDVLLTIDPSNYESAVAQAEFNLAQSQLALEQEHARAEQARKEWQSLSKGEPPPLAVRVPQLQAAEASVRWNQEALKRAQLDLARTKIRAPYAGMVRQKRADVGQYISPGTQLGTIFAVDQAEVRLPLSADELAYLDLPHTYRGEQAAAGPVVALSADIAGRTFTWEARIVRTEGIVDPSTRMIYAVARVENPYGRAADGDRPPLEIGQFVKAEITGRTVENVVVLPRQVLRGGTNVLVVDPETKELRTRPVQVIKTDPNNVVVGGGLNAGELICTTALEFVVEGMEVELYSDSPESNVGSDTSRLADSDKPDRAGGAL